MSKTKQLFIDLCEDTAFQYEMGVRNDTLRNNISYLAETRGIPMFSAIAIAETMEQSINNLILRKEPINQLSIATEFLSIMNK